MNGHFGDRIASLVRIVQVRCSQPTAPNSPTDWRTSLGQIAVRIDTENGLFGFGVGGGGKAAIHVIEAVLAPLLIGHGIEPIEAHWQRMYNATLPFGRKGIAVMALSGVDLALWDLRGKAAGKPVAEILGGNVGQAIATYTTVWDEVDPVTAGGTQAVKLHVHPQDRCDLIGEVAHRTEAARAVIGPHRALMIDAWMEWDVDTTLAIAERIRPLDIGWIEEPIPADDLAGYAELCRYSPIPIAGGEHEFTAIGFRELIERRLHQVLQPDACWCGGMTEMVKIYRMAQAAGLRVVPHRGAEVWGLHAVAALDHEPLAESGRPWMTWVRGQPEIEQGVIRLGTAPGFGVELEDG
jgi:L-alanine-DL-glutamate epimerase-like enolase superfamily enzyme